MRFPNGRLRAAATAAILCCAAPAAAAPNLLTNGEFSDYTVNGQASTTSYIVTGGQTSGSGGATLNGWSNTAYTFVFQPGAASSTGAVVVPGSNLALWGPEGGASSPYYSNNGLAARPGGGAYLASDGAYQQGYIYQTINNLQVGQGYQLSFWWAAAQQAGFTGSNTEGWSVYWGDVGLNLVSSFATQSVTNASKGFTAWAQQTYQVVATTTTMTLAFMATSAPGGTPPFSLLDGVSLTAMPEPASWALVGVGALALATAHGWRRRRSA